MYAVVTYEVVFEVRMHVVDAVVHDSRRDAYARVTQRPRWFHVQIQFRYATSLTRIVLHISTRCSVKFTNRSAMFSLRQITNSIFSNFKKCKHILYLTQLMTLETILSKI